MSDAVDDLASAKRIATGAALTFSQRPNFAPTCGSESDFATLVSDYYKFFREEIVDDVAYLRRSSKSSAIVDFDAAVYFLRSAVQHADNDEAASFYANFIGQEPDWGALGLRLCSMLSEALSDLVAEAVATSRDSQRRQDWASFAAVEVEAIFDSVAHDLDRSFTPNNRLRMLSEVRKRARHRAGAKDPVALTQELCVQTITANRRDLPTPYYTVLDHLGVLGTSDASAAMMIAYSVAALDTSLRNGAFLARVDDAWTAAHG